MCKISIEFNYIGFLLNFQLTLTGNRKSLKAQPTPTLPPVENGTVEDDSNLNGQAESGSGSGSGSGDEDDTGDTADVGLGTEQRSDSADVEDNDINEEADKDMKELQSQMNHMAINSSKSAPEESPESKGMCILFH